MNCSPESSRIGLAWRLPATFALMLVAPLTVSAEPSSFLLGDSSQLVAQVGPVSIESGALEADHDLYGDSKDDLPSGQGISSGTVLTDYAPISQQYLTVEGPLREQSEDQPLLVMPQGEGLVDPSDITVWRNALDDSAEEEDGAAGTAIPEPPGIVLVIALLVMVGLMSLLRRSFDTHSLATQESPSLGVVRNPRS